MLDMAAWGVSDITQFTWLTPPPKAHVSQAADLLEELGATEKSRITAHGRQMHKLACHPRIAHMLLKAEETDQVPLASDIAAVLEERVAALEGERAPALDGPVEPPRPAVPRCSTRRRGASTRNGSGDGRTTSRQWNGMRDPAERGKPSVPAISRVSEPGRRRRQAQEPLELKYGPRGGSPAREPPFPEEWRQRRRLCLTGPAVGWRRRRKGLL